MADKIDLIQAAAGYLELGLSVIALTGKMPNGAVHPQGLHSALMGKPESDADYALLERAFGHTMSTGVGILTGTPYFVVDIDGEEGAQAWKEIAGEADFMPDRWVAKTGRGLHLWYADLRPRRTRKLAPKLDLKATGGYVAAPPSLHPDGHHYEWLLEPDGPVLEAPAALIKLLDEQDWEQERKLVGKATMKRVRVPQFTDGKFWPTWGFDGVIESVKTAQEGNRNAALYWAAFTMTEEQADEDDFQQLAAAAVTAGLERRESRLTIRSAQKAARGG